MNLIDSDALKYYQWTKEALNWVTYDLYLDKVVDALDAAIARDDPDFWNIHVALCYLSKTRPVRSYLEIGTRRGRSLFQVLCHADVQRVVCVDLFVESHFHDLKNDVDRFLSWTRKDVRITYCRESSAAALPKVQGPFDLITIDGSHHYDDAVKDLDAAHGLLGENGAIVVDDVAQMPHLMRMVEEFKQKHPRYQLITTDQLYGCSILIQQGGSS